jgi:hypothetical protein
MGRTLPTFTQLVRQEAERWNKFRRALRKEDQEALDELFAAARFHSAAGAYASGAIPFETMILSMLIEEHKTAKALREKVEAWRKLRTNERWQKH